MTNEEFDLMLSDIDNKTVFESFVKAKSIVSEHNNISCSVSGGG